MIFSAQPEDEINESNKGGTTAFSSLFGMKEPFLRS